MQHLYAGFLMVFVPPLRWLAKRLVYAQGDGPDVEASKKHKIEYRAIGKPDGWKENDKVAFCKAQYKGSMYQCECGLVKVAYWLFTNESVVTGVFLAEGALTVLEDKLDLGGGGVFTPACLGQSFVDRVGTAGFTVETKTTVP